ncbi:MAG: protein kinase [Fuerstiella sp.]|nr:protein kinase [Fuerstiella sp.]
MDEQSIFLEALEKSSPENQTAWLNEACGNDEALKQRILKLLQRHEEAQSFLEQPAPGLEQTIVPDASGKNLAASLDAGLAPAFGEEAAVVIGDANHSVLRSLRNTLDEVPHVSLRESEAEGADPIAKPSSPEIPHHDSDSRYRLDGEIARGGMGAILKERDTDLGRDLAIKVLLDSHKDKPEVIQRFVEEAQIGGQLQHPGIAPIYELGQFKDKRPFFAMKLVKGQTLSKLLADRNDAADERGKLIGIFEQICQTMAYAHSRGVIHRDLKPANIMVGAFGEVQVMDWGLAKVLQVGGVADEKKSQTLQQGQSIIATLRSGVGSGGVGSDAPAFGSIGSETQMGSVMGTPAYMPPEQALGEIDNMDERAEVFGLGAILCEILTGQPPYVADDGTRVFRMAIRGKLDDAFSRLDACGADEDLIAITRQCLELDPVDRPRSSEVLAERVTGYLESVEEKLREAEVQRAAEAARADAEAAQATAEGQRAEAESARANEEGKRRRTSLALAASVLLLVGLGSGGWLYMLRQEANRQTAEADAQRQHAGEMQTLAEQRDVQRLAAEQSKSEALKAKTAAEQAEDRAKAEQIAAVAAKQLAQAAEEEGRKLLYATDMQLVDTLLKDDESSARQILSRLNAHDPDFAENANTDNATPEDDLRGFEWHYFKSILEKRSVTFDGFDQSVVGSALTANGELVTLDSNAQLRRFDAATRIETRPPLDLKTDRPSVSEVVKVFKAAGVDEKMCSLFEVSADGRMAALTSGTQVHIVNTTTGAELVPAIATLGTYGVTFSPDATMLITVDAKIAWWDTATGKQLASGCPESLSGQ